MICNSVLERWDTPIANASSITIESIEADGYLSITLRATVCKHVLLICFSFLNYQWYQIKRFAPTYNAEVGRTQIHDYSIDTELNPTSLLNLKAFHTAIVGSSDCLLESLPCSSNHFVFIEDKSEIEVISIKQPTITLIGTAPLNKRLVC